MISNRLNRKVFHNKYIASNFAPSIVDMFCELHSRENIIKDIETENTYILLENKEIIGTGTKNRNHEFKNWRHRKY